MRRIICGMLMVFIVLSMCACGNSESQADGVVNVRLQNRVPDRITVMSASWSIDGNTIGTTCVEVAGGGKCLGEDFFSFPIYAEDIENEKKLENLALTIRVTEENGGTFDAATVSLPSKYGDSYNLELRFEDGNYTLWQVYENGTNVRLIR